MSRAFLIMVIVVTGIAVFIIASGGFGPACALTPEQCKADWNDCILRICPKDTPKGSQDRHNCNLSCDDDLLRCLRGEPGQPATSIGPLPNPPPKIIGQPPNPVGVEQPPGGKTSPPAQFGGQPPVNVGVNQPSGGGSSPPKVPIGLLPTKPVVGVEQPPSGSGSGTTPIYDKSGTGKSVTTTSPIGITTTTVYDANGNSTSTNTDPTGKILSKTTTMLGQAGATTSTTTDANGNILSTTTKTPDKRNGGYISVIRNNKGEVSSSAAYDKTGKIVSQSAKIITSTTGTGGNYSTGKGHEKVFLGEGSQKYKEKAMNEVFHQDKQNLNSSPAPSHPQGRHR